MTQFFGIITEMAPYLLLGFLFAGLLHAFIPTQFYGKYLSRSNFSSVLYATLLGIPLPLCSGKGLGRKLAYRPFLLAMALTAARKARRLSAADKASVV